MENEKTDAPKDRFQQEFEALPLEEKIKKLLRLEAVTLGEAFNYGVNESMKAADRLGDVLSDFGKKVETEFKKATCKPDAAAPPPDPSATPSAGAPPKPKSGPSRKSPPRRPKM